MALFPPRPGAIVSYDYFDIAEGTGYSIFYGARGDNAEYLTTDSSQLYTEDVLTASTQSIATTATRYLDLDFDVTFNLPKNIKGRILANIPIGLRATQANQYDFEYYVIVKAIHYDGSTETTLATGTSKTISFTGGNGITTTGKIFTAMITLCEMDVTTVKHFKKGETLRFTVEGWYKCLEAGAQNAQPQIAHNPRDEDYSQFGVVIFGNEPAGGGTTVAESTRMSFHVPFRLDI